MYSELVKWCAGSCQMLIFSKDLLTHTNVCWIFEFPSMHPNVSMVKVMIGTEKICLALLRHSSAT